MRSYLVVGNQTLDSPELARAVAERVASGPSTFLPVTVVTTRHESVPSHPG